MANPNKTLGSALENRVVERAKAKGLKAARQPGSGVYKAFPHDAVVEQLLVECKVRSTHLNAAGDKTLSIQLEWLRKVQEKAIEGGFEQGIVVVNPKGSQKPLVLCDLDWFLGILSKLT
jgi:Holliday junction resolvase